MAQAGIPAEGGGLLFVGAHPDDGEFGCGGTTARLREEKRPVMFVSMTNGDAGHAYQGGGQLAKRRREEARRSGEFLGLTDLVLDNHDGELEPSLENRRVLIRIIREFRPDVIVTHRPNDYHADHRAVSLLVQDSAALLCSPAVSPSTPCLTRVPVILYAEDSFTRPTRFSPDVIVDITHSFPAKMRALALHESQVFEWLPWVDGLASEVPTGAERRLRWLTARSTAQHRADRYRAILEEALPRNVPMPEYVEAFEISECGAPLDERNMDTMLPAGSVLTRLPAPRTGLTP